MNTLALNGLGRIGRLLVRRLGASRPGLLGAVNDPAPLEQLVHLLRYDSVHGPADRPIEGFTDGVQDFLLLGDHRVPLFHASDPAEIPFPASTRLVVEASGRFTRRADAARHLKARVSHVLISAPSPDADYTVIDPVNGAGLDPDRHRVISNASCTAHATAPMLKILEDAFGIEHAGMSTVHVVTNDQRLLDLPHKDLRRARAAFQSIIPTTSSAFGALHRAMPGLPAAFDGVALRVPTLNVNLVDLVATLRREVDAAAVNASFEAAIAGPWKNLVGLAPPHAVSCDITGRAESVLMDLGLTMTLGPRFVKVFGWHDNETGYAARLGELVVDLAGRI
ncbi:type I glyceraldehyde-3-phosphate dehydrogenase [Geothrix edaphica]|uniref:Glyceraldehyde-3-phosphate dehydrogenase n=1 Tax=Geothrix edaphica TaxID=2927976 RepID=A0ABQ5PWP5_9BACT|nr:glyceraldehyde 3-phosphate dehydrogenase NAD-binding domain-containing protein [Geothrix edaphica]GLH66788.1 glyceraldehyde-3-phosphate dehydrogenase [Geothrix edaphica]